jgi:hypothetical protein
MISYVSTIHQVMTKKKSPTMMTKMHCKTPMDQSDTTRKPKWKEEAQQHHKSGIRKRATAKDLPNTNIKKLD